MGLIEDYKNGKRYGTDWQAPSFQHMNDLVGAASNAQDNAIAANTKATTAESNSSTALQKATTAETNSANAVDTANKANTKSDNANIKADNANTKSDNAVSTANSANTKATNAETTATNLTQAPDVTEADKFGVVKVEIIGTGTNKKFKFSNLKGNGIVSVTKTNTNKLVDTYTITFDNAKTSTFNVTNGDAIQLRVADGYFQWKYTEATTWNNLLSLGELSNVDQTLSESSTNAIANSAVTKALATKAAQNALDALNNAAVHKTGDESIDGIKSFVKGLVFANATWNTVGDDAYFGDKNQAGCVCVKGANGKTGIAFLGQSNETIIGKIIYDEATDTFEI